MAEPAAPPVAWGDGRVTVADRWTYHWGARRRPFVHPLTTPAGRVLTVDAPDDHPWHHGLWFTIKFVNGDNYWEELAPYGVLRHRDDPPVMVAEGADGAVTVAGWLDWIAPDRETTVLRERRSFHHRPLTADAYAIDVEVDLAARVDCTLDRTPFNGDWGGYGGLALRGSPALVDSTLTTVAGTATRLLAERSPWLHLAGRVDGADVGVALLDAPTNPDHPVPWYGSTRAPTYGEGWANFVNAAFLWHGPRTLPAGEHLSFAYRVVVHDGHWPADRVADAWDAYRDRFPTP